MTRYDGSGEFRGAEFVDLSMAASLFRQVDLSGVRMRGALLFGADIDGAIDGLRINGIEVAPLVAAELDRRHPERVLLGATTPDGMREAWGAVESFWAGTMLHAGALPEEQLHRSVNEEWSYAQTLRHLVFATDAWLGHAVLGRARPFHRIALPPTFIKDADTYGIDARAEPTYAEVVQVRTERMAQVRDFLAEVDQGELDRERGPNTAPGWPPPAPRTAIECLHVIFAEEWAHHRFAVRDLGLLTA
jgi:DinB superfamily